MPQFCSESVQTLSFDKATGRVRKIGCLGTRLYVLMLRTLASCWNKEELYMLRSEDRGKWNGELNPGHLTCATSALSMGSLLRERIFWSIPDGVLMAGCQVCDWAISVPPVQYILRIVGAGGFPVVSSVAVSGGGMDAGVICHAQSSQVVFPLKWSFRDHSSQHREEYSFWWHLSTSLSDCRW